MAHVEAGLRTGDLSQPFPEEMNRVVTARLAAMHFAPTAEAAAALLREGVPEPAIHVTGNTGIDAVLFVVDGLDKGTVERRRWPWRDRVPQADRIDEPPAREFRRRVRARDGSRCRTGAPGDVQVVYPVHRNPNVSGPARRIFEGHPHVTLIDPQPYVPFVDLMRQSWMLLTDSGGIQEEAPSLGKPVLVLREKTERPEAVTAGTVKLVGTEPRRILEEATGFLDDPVEYSCGPASTTRTATGTPATASPKRCWTGAPGVKIGAP